MGLYVFGIGEANRFTRAKGMQNHRDGQKTRPEGETTAKFFDPTIPLNSNRHMLNSLPPILFH